MNPNTTRARALRACGIVLTVIGVLIAIPFIVVKLFIDASAARR